MTSPFAHRGVIEGFYGAPYSDADRRWLIECMGRHGMNAYCYAPKNDPLQRAEWRTPYSIDAMERFSSLITHGAAHGVGVGFCLSPGLSMRYSDAADVQQLVEKLQRFVAIGARFLMLAFDDVPSHLVHDDDRSSFDSLADAHVAVTQAVHEALGHDVPLIFGPVDYVGVESTEYLDRIGRALPGEIEIFWTGRTVCSPEIRTEEAASRATTLRRRVLVWDNVPVSDGPMRPMLHLGPFARREPGLAQHCSGFLLNTMEHAHASAVAVLGAARWMRDPAHYDPEAAWREACETLGAGAPQAFLTFAKAHRFSAIHPEDRDAELDAAFARLRRAYGNADEATRRADRATALQAMRELLDARATCAATLRSDLIDRDLAREIEPWLASHHAHTQRMLAALQLIETVCNESIARLHRVVAFFGLAAKMNATAAADTVSYGPRRAFYPQLASLRDEDAGFGDDPALFLDRCLADEVCRFAEQFALTRLGGRVG